LKVLVLRFSSIGDIVLTTPVVRCLKQQTSATVHFLCKEAFRSVVEANPHIDRVFTFQKNVSEVIPALKAEKYDLVVDLHRNLRSMQVKWSLGRPSRTFDKLNFEKWLLVNLKINRLPDVHIVDRYMAAVKSLGVRYDGQGLDFFIPEGHDWRNSAQAQRMPAAPYTAFVIGATHATKRLPEEKMVDICRQVKQPLVLLGGKSEAETGARVAMAAGAHVIDLCGQLSLYESASVVRDAAQVLTHDTGLMHIAAAFRKPVISVWGNTVPEFGMYPFYPTGANRNTSFEVNGLSCRPCSKIGFEKCPKGHFSCMNGIANEALAARLNGLNDPKK
jgi:ADP-heptose:LPS heptosyltransferase